MMSASVVLTRERPLRQFVQFVVVGASNTLISFVAYSLLFAVQTPPPVAAALAFALGAVNGYVLNRRWTFAARDSRRARALYVGVQVGGTLMTSGLVWLFVSKAGAGSTVAYLAAIPPVNVGKFLANRRWTFADRAPVVWMPQPSGRPSRAQPGEPSADHGVRGTRARGMRHHRSEEVRPFQGVENHRRPGGHGRSARHIAE
jgi:putative flippase GtrA